MAEQLRVFVSHSHQDNAFCQQIVRALRDAGADVWYDEHNLGWGVLKDEIVRELGVRPVFVLILSKAVFASKWVKRETDWAEELYDREPTRLMLFVTAGQIERADFGTDNGWLAYYGYKRIEAPGFAPYPADEAARRLVRIFGLTPAGEAPTPVAPQPTEDVDDLLARGKALNAQQQYAKALPLFTRATQLAPGSYSAWMNVGYTFRQIKDWKSALSAYEHAVALDDTQANGWTGVGLALLGLKQYDMALAACTRGTELQDRKYSYAWNGKGNALKGLKRYQEALAAYDEAIRLLPTNCFFRGNRAWVLRKLGRNTEAEAEEKRVKELCG